MATTINDLESLILFFLNDGIKEAHAKEQYEVVEPYTDDMLSWKRPIQIQSLLIDNLVRVGTVGDGNCLLHSILFAGSPSYRAQNASTRTKLADAFRDVLKARDFELMELADVLYAEIGGDKCYGRGVYNTPRTPRKPTRSYCAVDSKTVWNEFFSSTIT
jgi:hypothetical protein